MRETEAFDRAAVLLPGALRSEALFQPEACRAGTEEIRLRCGSGAWLCLPDETVRLRSPVGPAEIEETVLRATKNSIYAAEESFRSGYFTAEGGLRLGGTGDRRAFEASPPSASGSRIPYTASRMSSWQPSPEGAC